MKKYRLDLVAGRGKLRLNVARNGWCHCHWISDSRSIYLGSDSIDLIARRLLDDLESDEPIIMGEIEGTRVGLVKTFCGAHCSIYMGKQGNERVLFVENEQAAVVSRVRLTPDERAEWCEQLRPLVPTC